jgi:hypothetical protein
VASALVFEDKQYRLQLDLNIVDFASRPMISLRDSGIRALLYIS